MTTDYACVYVDAGYLFSSVAKRITGSSFRNAVRLESKAALLTEIIEFARNDSGMPILRVLWYDGASNGRPDSHQMQFASLPGVKLRIGRMSPHTGEQKGVDVRIALDLVKHAASGPVRCAYLLSGDDDLSEAVDAAQEDGMIVRILSVPSAGENPVPFAVSRNLRHTADDTLMLSPARIDELFERRDPVAAAAADAAEEAAEEAADTEEAEVEHVPETPPSAPVEEKPEPEPAAADVTTKVITKEAVEEPVESRPSPVSLPRRRLVPTAPTSRPVYSSAVPEPATVSRPLRDESSVIDRWERIGVPTKVVESLADTAASTATGFFLSTTPAGLSAAMRSRPEIPLEVDRILMIDGSNRLGVDYIEDHLRPGLRDLFWDALDKVHTSMGGSS